MQFNTLVLTTLLAAAASALPGPGTGPGVNPPAGIIKRERCNDIGSPCQIQKGDNCYTGYAACLERMGCTNVAGGADCIGLSMGEFFFLLDLTLSRRGDEKKKMGC